MAGTNFVLTFGTFLKLSVLMKCFNGFCKEGVVRAETVEEILQMMGLRVAKKALQDIIEEVDEDGEDEEPRILDVCKGNST